ncbi:mitogen-activated protein kinase kinase 4 [Clonorchis sinensis]|uniref:mitogen-activated protein kinase kinase n=1 Tax=Clonorchis sinensis TaxID=79923 RepID=G7YFB3_CLOSI|nr:mitogen-activated protein kinase kinase 4 [Clonorchis sinensis]
MPDQPRGLRPSNSTGKKGQIRGHKKLSFIDPFGEYLCSARKRMIFFVWNVHWAVDESMSSENGFQKTKTRVTIQYFFYQCNRHMEFDKDGYVCTTSQQVMQRFQILGAELPIDNNDANQPEYSRKHKVTVGKMDRLPTEVKSSILSHQLQAFRHSYRASVQQDLTPNNSPRNDLRGFSGIQWPEFVHHPITFLTLVIKRGIHDRMPVTHTICDHEGPRKSARIMPICYLGRTTIAQQYRSELAQRLSTVKKYCDGSVHVDEAWQNVKGAILAAFTAVCPTSPIRPQDHWMSSRSLSMVDARKAIPAGNGHTAYQIPQASCALIRTASFTTVFTANDLADEGEIGRGAFGFVNRMLHIPTGSVMAVKRMRSTLNESEQTKTLKDLDVVMHSSNCPFIVRFYGALFEEGDCWICMEMMATSLDKFYKFVYRYLLSRIPEGILAKIAVATIAALDYLKVELKVIHRAHDLKTYHKREIQLGCSDGISGELVDSIAKSHDVGCKPYMAPERIHPNLSANGYDIRSDVWSFGITMVELATGQFPYPAWNSVFEQLTCVLNGDPPCLPERLPSFSRLHLSGSTTTVSEVDTKMESGGLDDDSDFSSEFRDFVSQCLQKDVRSRPKYHTLMFVKLVDLIRGEIRIKSLPRCLTIVRSSATIDYQPPPDSSFLPERIRNGAKRIVSNVFTRHG